MILLSLLAMAPGIPPGVFTPILSLAASVYLMMIGTLSPVDVWNTSDNIHKLLLINKFMSWNEWVRQKSF
jgi:hypothetical protein